MSIKRIMATACAALLSASAASALAQDTKTGDEQPARACCMAACGQEHVSGKMRCSLTGQTVETCCCVHREGRLHCTLADKDVESCCCKPETEDTGGTDKTDQTGNEKPRE